MKRAILMFMKAWITRTATATIRPSYIPNLTPANHGAKNRKSVPSIWRIFLENKSSTKFNTTKMNENIINSGDRFNGIPKNTTVNVLSTCTLQLTF